jgi:hypothetical protein
VTEERPPSIFAARLRFWLLSGAVVGLTVGVLALMILTRTDWGRAQVLGFTLTEAAERLDGTLEVQRLEGNLLTGAFLRGVVLRGPDGLPFVAADSVFVEYSLRTITGGEIVLDRIVLFGADVELRMMPGDTLWNYDKIFGDTVRVEPAPMRTPIVVRAATLVDSRVLVEMPWEPDPELTPAERQAEIHAALADTSRVLVREAPGGFLRRYQLEEVEADILRLVSAPDELGGTSLRIEEFASRIRLFREPVRVERLSGDLRFQHSILEFRLSELRLPASRLAGYGAIGFGNEDGPQMDITMRGDTVAFRDLLWLYPRFPTEAGGSLELVIETRPDGTLYLARALDVSAPGTRLFGSFGLILNEAMHFVDVELSADPLRVETIEEMLPLDLPVVGLRIGAVEIRQAGS